MQRNKHKHKQLVSYAETKLNHAVLF